MAEIKDFDSLIRFMLQYNLGENKIAREVAILRANEFGIEIHDEKK